ncbi:hypothetical protein CHLNCDRAFT_58050 [Chlorella variabilis]|uniref:RRM domain-containing protein n=1 Tax=Chlorella variabilis TaxID=554065 RepID=E1ZGL1_CHLVA|nr:hypothetical protein CHLNCDRAFT_58050 [Chlorella variabilis]EFN54776.1 hypothetical protein CHLNCDRAFT_58050 [Chlorella variabilis]|eukprot:XP_005846878.1 hypothetical protein CHLNCDRAFT_58050 [Chlorella variabilis]
MDLDRPRDRDRDRDRSERRRDKDDGDRRRDDRDRDRDRRRRSRSRSRSRDRRRRSRSRSRDRRRSRSPDYDPEGQRRRPTWFDIPPIGGAPPPLTQLPGAVQVFSAPGGGGGGGGGGAFGGGGGMAAASAGAAMSQQATRHARRIYPMSGADAAERIFIGGLPYYLTEEQCRELLASFGAIKSFDLVKDKETGQSKGYGFCVYEDPRVTDVACQGLNGMRMGDRTLTVRRATEGQRQQAEQKQQDMYVGNTARVVKLSHAVTLEELGDDQEYGDIMEDMKEECGKYGTVVQVHIPRPAPPSAPPPPGLGKIIIEFAETPAAMAARNAMHGRKFGGRVVEAVMMGDSDYSQFKWD